MTIEQIGVFTPEQARQLWQDYLTRTQSNPQLQQNYPQRRALFETSPHRVFVKNTESETIPAYGCLRITGTVASGGRTALTVEKPSSTEGEFVFNGPYSIAASGVGWAYRFGVVNMLGAAPSSANTTYLPIVNSWQIEEGAGPFVVFGEDTAITDGLVGRFSSTASSSTIRFEIYEADCEARSAIVRVLSRKGSVPGEYEIIGEAELNETGDSVPSKFVEVYDKVGCYLNESNRNLAGRIGYATYLTGRPKYPYQPWTGFEITALAEQQTECEAF